MFKLNGAETLITKHTTIAENHGDEVKIAYFLHFALTTTADILDEFENGFKESNYEIKPDDDLDLAEQAEEKPVFWRRRHTSMKINPSSKWVGGGYRMVISEGVSGDSDLILIDCLIDKFNFELKDDGIVVVRFRLKTYTENSADIAHMPVLQKRKVPLTLEPPSMERVPGMFDGEPPELKVVDGTR